jgi:hypothetical protein
MKKPLIFAMNEWGFFGQEILAEIGKNATIDKFKIKRGYV